MLIYRVFKQSHSYEIHAFSHQFFRFYFICASLRVGRRNRNKNKNKKKNNNNIKLISYNRDCCCCCCKQGPSLLPLLLSISPGPTLHSQHCCNNCNCNSLLIMRNYLLTFTTTGSPKKLVTKKSYNPQCSYINIPASKIHIALNLVMRL